MTNLTEQYRELEQDFFAYQKMLNEANKDLNKYYLENTKLKTENKWYSEQLNEAVKEIAKLKELLKEVLRHELSLKEVSELSRKISQVLGEE